MENFFYDDEFFSDFGEFIELLEDENDCEIKDLPDDFSVEISHGELVPILQLSIDDINTDTEYYSEDNEDYEYSEIIKVLRENIDFEKINSLMPKNYRRTKNKESLTKEILLSLI